MAHKASAFHLEKTISANGGKHQLEHNTRAKPPRYLIGAKNGEIGFECNRELHQALALKEKMISEAKDAYERNRKGRARKFQATAYEWSAVCNLTNAHTMSDLENLAQKIHDNYGFQCYQISIHRDEGYLIDKKTNARLVSSKDFWLNFKTGIYYKDRAQTQILANNETELALHYTKEINYHAHLEFITLDKNTGKNRQAELNRTKLRELQTLVANELKMERGVDRCVSQIKRIKPREYGEKVATAHNVALKTTKDRQFNAELEKNLADKDMLLEKYRAEREEMKKSGKSIQSDYSKLKAKNEELEQQIKAKNLTIDDMNRQFAELKEEIAKERELRKKAELRIAELESKIAQNRDFADTKATAPVQPKSAEVAPSVEKTQNIEQESFSRIAMRAENKANYETAQNLSFEVKENFAFSKKAEMHENTAIRYKESLIKHGMKAQIYHKPNPNPQKADFSFGIIFAITSEALKLAIEFVKSKFELTKELKTIDKEPTLLNQNFTKNNKPKINEKAKSKQNDSYGMSM